MALKFLLVSLVAAAGAMETPLWFIKTGLSGSFDERSDQCKAILKEGGDEARVASFYPIVIPEGESSDICIRFPKTDKLPGGWRHDKGEVGQCNAGCCLFLPPVSNIAELRKKVQPTWFETTSDCGDKFAAKETMVNSSLETARSLLVVLDVAFSMRNPNE